MKIHPVVAELIYADGQKDMTKLIVAFRNFANEHKKLSFNTHCRKYNVRVRFGCLIFHTSLSVSQYISVRGFVN
jgi:hypothetical protein